MSKKDRDRREITRRQKEQRQAKAAAAGEDAKEDVAKAAVAAPEDAADVAQETLTDFLRDYRAGKYDRRRGRLRSWISGIARHRVLDTLRQRARNQATRGESAFDELPDDARLTAIWDAATTGAGDMYAAGLLHGITSGMTWKQAGHLASHAAARIVTQLGARLSNRFTAAEIDELTRQ